MTRLNDIFAVARVQVSSTSLSLVLVKKKNQPEKISGFDERPEE